MMHHGVVVERAEGTPQGGPLSLLLANLLLDEWETGNWTDVDSRLPRGWLRGSLVDALLPRPAPGSLECLAEHARELMNQPI